MSRLDIEEKDILDAFESGKLKRVDDIKGTLKTHRKAAEASFKKDARINIRLSSRDLRAIQAKALHEGIPYQTLISSLIHKYVDGQLVEQTFKK
jgi:predicted DNA binding CopG/RHH family protein